MRILYFILDLCTATRKNLIFFTDKQNLNIISDFYENLVKMTRHKKIFSVIFYTYLLLNFLASVLLKIHFSYLDVVPTYLLGFFL